MAKATFKCAECGDSVTVSGSNRSDADRLAEYRAASGALCSECWAKAQAEQRAQDSQKAAEEAAQIGLPVLTGTEKQVAWAETIRKERLSDLASMLKSFSSDSEEQIFFGVISDLTNLIRAQNSGHWWIENRSEGFWRITYDMALWLVGGSTNAKKCGDDINKWAEMARSHMGGLKPLQTETAPPDLVADAKMDIVEVGKPYPFPVAASSTGGASAQFLMQSGNILQIMMPELSKGEIASIARGTMRVGFLAANSAILWLFAFGDIEFDCPFDARLIPRYKLDLPSIENKDQRLLVEVHLVDAYHILHALRAVTFPANITREFLTLVQDQLSSYQDPTEQFHAWQDTELWDLIKTCPMELYGQ
jgi:hypothetical protein